MLFLFNLVYLLGSKANLRIPNISRPVAIAAIFGIGLVSSLLVGGLLGFRSWTLTPLIDFENERLLVYFMTFLLGVLYYRQDAFAKQSGSKTLYTVASSIAWIPVTVHIFARLYPILYPDGFAVTLVYRLIWWVSFDLSLLVMAYVMIESFRRYFNRTGRLWSELNRNSYGVYIIHVIMIGVFGTMLLNLNLPALVKYPVLIVSTYLVSNLIVSMYRSLAHGLKSSSRSVTAKTADAA